MKRVPCLEHAGIKTIVNGPISYTPDGSPISARRGACAINGTGHSGVTAAGGASWQLAEWIVGASPASTCSVRSRRFGRTRKRYTVVRTKRIATFSPFTIRTKSVTTRGRRANPIYS
jgi:dimethylglycine dehydrogenase